MNRDKTVIMLAKVKSKQTLGKAKSGYNRVVKPFKIQYADDGGPTQYVKTV